MLRRITRIARNVGRENGTRTLAEALGCLYDADGNPRLDKPPLKGEPEKLFCARYGNVPDVCANWLRTTAMQRPLADLLIAIYKADRDDPEDVIRIANEIQLNRAPTVIELRPNTVLVGHVSEIGLQVIRTQPQAVRIVSSPRLKAVNGR